jgi:hypothetical protein
VNILYHNLKAISITTAISIPPHLAPRFKLCSSAAVINELLKFLPPVLHGELQKGRNRNKKQSVHDALSGDKCLEVDARGKYHGGMLLISAPIKTVNGQKATVFALSSLKNRTYVLEKPLAAKTCPHMWR